MEKFWKFFWKTLTERKQKKSHKHCTAALRQILRKWPKSAEKNQPSWQHLLIIYRNGPRLFELFAGKSSVLSFTYRKLHRYISRWIDLLLFLSTVFYFSCGKGTKNTRNGTKEGRWKKKLKNLLRGAHERIHRWPWPHTYTAHSTETLFFLLVFSYFISRTIGACVCVTYRIFCLSFSYNFRAGWRP